MHPADEKEKLAACIDMDFVEEIPVPQRRAPVSFDSLINLVCVLPHRKLDLEEVRAHSVEGNHKRTIWPTQD
jgi:hypothetical protein